MDLLGDIGNQDQLVSTRAENAILSKKVKELTAQVKQLQLDNMTLKAEVELYREEALKHGTSSTDKGKQENINARSAAGCNDDDDVEDVFIRSGDKNYVNDPAVTLSNPSGSSNPICCSMNSHDTLLAIGSADAKLSIFAWGSALAPSPEASRQVVENGLKHALNLGAPVISTCFSYFSTGSFLAAGCMDGSVHVTSYANNGSSLSFVELEEGHAKIKHGKYVKCLEWSPSAPILASASADGVIILTKVTEVSSSSDYSFEDVKTKVKLESMEKFHLDGAIESMCFLDNGNTLCCYARGTPHLTYFHLNDSCKIVKHSLNGEVTGGFDTHVSFSIMSLAPSPGNQGKFLAAATDASRNIILQSNSSKQIRNLYGHKNDGFSNPKIAWSKNAQYIYGNSQDENCVCVWDCASSSIVQKLDDSIGGHTGQLRDFYSSPNSDTFATISYDKTAKIWLPGM